MQPLTVANWVILTLCTRRIAYRKAKGLEVKLKWANTDFCATSGLFSAVVLFSGIFDLAEAYRRS